MTKKKFYQQPQAKFIEVKQADIIATSNEQLGDGGNIFGARGAYYDEEDY